MPCSGERCLRIHKVLERVPVGKSTLWRWVKKGTFPKPYKLSPGTTVWSESDVDAWLATKFESTE